jgi:uncharacterized protein YdaU (DUF1376 family)
VNGYPKLRMDRMEDEKEVKKKELSFSSSSGGDEASVVAKKCEEEVKKTSEKAAAAAAAEKEAAEVARKTAETMKVDSIAISHLSLALFPLVIGFSLKSLVMEEHHSWYSWFIASLTGTCYTV